MNWRGFLPFSRGGHSRLLPLGLLLLAGLLLGYLEETPLASLRNAQFDHYQRLMPRQRNSEPAIVVAIDSAGIEKYGPWPWPRTLLAQLVERLHAAGAKAIGVDLLLAEPDQYSRDMLAKRLPDLPASGRERLPDPDRMLAAALAGAPTVLAVSGIAQPLPGARFPNKPLPDFRVAPAAESALTRYASSLTSLPLLARAAHGEGLINAAPDRLTSPRDRGVLRRVPSVVVIDFVPLLSLPLEMARQSLGQHAVVAAESGAQGMERIRIGGHSLPVQPNGEILLYFGRPSSHYYLSAADVLAGNFLPDTFPGRFVFIGITTTGLQDRVITPLGDNLPGVDIHVQALESLLSGEALQRPVWMPRLELAVLVLSGLLLIFVIPSLQPRYAALVFLAGIGAILGGGYLAFRGGLYLFDGASVALLLSPVFIALLSSTLIAADRRRQQAETDLQASREAAARVAGELDAARRIQMGLLPDPGRAFVGETRFELAALLEPARAVGGDYYDCFALDERRLCLAIGDVSGKGLPASLFMAVSKTLTGALTRRNRDLGQALREVESELNRENPEFLFVTAFVAVLDADSGDLDYVCAGHDAPLLLRDGRIGRLDTQANSGPPLCALGDYPYGAAQTRLQAGDILLLFTDGASEASNGDAFYGCDRLAATLAATAGEQSLAARLETLRDDIRRFEAGTPAHDDLTLLLLKFSGR